MSIKNPELFKNYESEIFFESGTYKGDTAKYASTIFKRVITVELQKYLHEEARENNKGSQIEFYLGDSPGIIETILKEINDDKVTFWLDAHIDPGNYIRGVTPEIRECPLMEELSAIRRLKRKDHNILVDDLRLFSKRGGWGSGLKVEHVINKILEINPNYKISYLDGEVLNDVLVATV